MNKYRIVRKLNDLDDYTSIFIVESKADKKLFIMKKIKKEIMRDK